MSHSSRIETYLPQNGIEEKIKIYLYYPGDVVENCLLHQRIYMNLIGSGACVNNFYSDVNMVSAEADLSNYGEVEGTAEQWLERVAEENDYIYFLSVDERTEYLFKTFLDFEPKEQDLYKIDKESKKLISVDSMKSTHKGLTT